MDTTSLADHYSDAYTTTPGQCFRMIISSGGPDHCPEPITHRGTHINGKGQKVTVESCPGHAGNLTDLRPV